MIIKQIKFGLGEVGSGVCTMGVREEGGEEVAGGWREVEGVAQKREGQKGWG